MIVWAIAAAGGLGAAARFLLDQVVNVYLQRLSATMVVNGTACFAVGLLVGLAADDQFTAIVGLGFLGGYSTFSTASVEAAGRWREGRRGAALLHSVAMVVVCVATAGVGLTIAAWL